MFNFLSLIMFKLVSKLQIRSQPIQDGKSSPTQAPVFPPPAAPPRPRSEVLAHRTPQNPLASFHPEASGLPRAAPTLPFLPWPICPRPRLPSPQWSPTRVLPAPVGSFTQTKPEAARAQTRGLRSGSKGKIKCKEVNY